MSRFDNQVAIVTGGAQGIGGATARRLAEEGAHVLIADVDDEIAEGNVQHIRAAGGVAEYVHADVGRHEDIRAMVQRSAALWGRLDILVNNAYAGSEGSNGSALNVTEEGWNQGMSVLVKSMFLGAKYAVPEMRKAGGGSIVNISSVHGLLVAPEAMVYEVGKAAVIAITRQMACDFGPDNIRVNSICPGHIVTERSQTWRWDKNPEGLRFLKNLYPLRRAGRPVDIANAIVFLCSDEASFITGHALAVDGGLTVQLQEDLAIRQARYTTETPGWKLPW